MVVEIGIQVVFDVISVELLFGAEHINQLVLQCLCLAIAVSASPIVVLRQQTKRMWISGCAKLIAACAQSACLPAVKDLR